MSRRRKALVRGLIVMALAALGIQFVPVARTNPQVISDLIAPADIKEILERSCYDCHSHETAWPWYSRVAPVSWFVARHVNNGRRELNFSDWPLFDFQSQQLLQGEIGEQVQAGKMPLRSYVLGHPAARLTDEDRAVLMAWAAGD